MDKIIKKMRDLELDESEQKELKKIVSDMEDGLVYRSFRIKTTGKISAKLGYIIDTEYPACEISFQTSDHSISSDEEIFSRKVGEYYDITDDEISLYTSFAAELATEYMKKNKVKKPEHSSTEICQFCKSVLVSIKLKTGK